MAPCAGDPGRAACGVRTPLSDPSHLRTLLNNTALTYTSLITHRLLLIGESQTRAPRANKAGSCCPDEPWLAGSVLPGTIRSNLWRSLEGSGSHHPCLPSLQPPEECGQRKQAQLGGGASTCCHHPHGFIGGRSLGGTASPAIWGTGPGPLLVYHRPASGPIAQDSRSTHHTHSSQSIPAVHRKSPVITCLGLY